MESWCLISWSGSSNFRSGISKTFFSGFRGLLPVDQQSRYFQLFTAPIKRSQWIPVDFLDSIGFKCSLWAFNCPSQWPTP